LLQIHQPLIFKGTSFKPWDTQLLGFGVSYLRMFSIIFSRRQSHLKASQGDSTLPSSCMTCIRARPIPSRLGQCRSQTAWEGRASTLKGEGTKLKKDDFLIK